MINIQRRETRNTSSSRPAKTRCPYLHLEPMRRLFQERDAEHRARGRHYLMTSRFSTATLAENARYRAAEGAACVYSVPAVVDSHFVPLGALMFVLEMNNDTNRIEAVGLVRHAMPRYRARDVYEKSVHNVFSYVGSQRLARAEMDAAEERAMRALDLLCFGGSRHQKRLKGLQLFPAYFLRKCEAALGVDLMHAVAQMFARRLTVPEMNAETVDSDPHPPLAEEK